MNGKSVCTCLFLMLLFGTASCSNKSETEPKDEKLEKPTVEMKDVKLEVPIVEVQRLHRLDGESPVVFRDSIDIKLFNEAVKTAVKEPGLANMSDPMYKVTVGDDSYFLWLINGQGTIMNAQDTHTIYSLQEHSTKALELLFTTTFPAVKKDGTLDMSAFANFPLDPDNVGNYIGELHPTPIEEVKNGVYIQGVHAHRDRQLFQIFSKVSKGDYQLAKARLEGENLIIEITSHKATNGEVSHHNVIYGLSMKENPRYYVVVRNGETEKKEEIPYAIE